MEPIEPSSRWKPRIAALLASLSLAACGGGSDGGGVSQSGSVDLSVPGAPAATGDIAVDGRNWINFRRVQAGLSALTPNTVIDKAAQAHSNYQLANNDVTHTETSGKSGFTGATLLDRLSAAGYVFASGNSYAYGEVISASTSRSGAYLAEELVTAIYHRFVIFEPVFKEVGAGAATSSQGYSYFTADFTANNGYGPGLGRNAVTVWPFNGQTGVPPNFLSDYEQPDPIPNANEVGYPISVHADINLVVNVASFSVREHGASADLPVRLLVHATDAETPAAAAAIVPLAPLKGGTTYDVQFSGTLNGSAIARNWSFTTK